MKRVRFESPLKLRDINIMIHDSECHSPRPYIDKGTTHLPFKSDVGPQLLPYVNDPVHRFEFGNSSPYPTARKSCTPTFSTAAYQQSPSSDLDLSLLDFTCQEPRSQPQRILHPVGVESIRQKSNILTNTTNIDLPNTLKKNDDFFLKRENRDNFIEPSYKNVKMLTLEKENYPLIQKIEMMKLGKLKEYESNSMQHQISPIINSPCNCHHCSTSTPINCVQSCTKVQECYCVSQKKSPHHCNMQIAIPHACKCLGNTAKEHLRAIDKKAWAVGRYEQTMAKKCECLDTHSVAPYLDMEPQNAVVKEKREPTVTDLYKIIKLQNEQLQLLQEKVDSFIAASQNEKLTNQHHHNYITDHVALQSVESEQHKISIGVMTSFEMVRTSTVINKEIIQQSEAQIQCNRSQISIKEVISKSQQSNSNVVPPVNINFLDGISKKNDANSSLNNDLTKNTAYDDKTLNELSLYNVQVDNATTPLMSPDQTMYLDVKDYSDSDAESDNPSNVGWTYYNKVMTRVNGMLQDSDMPSSASALYRNVRQKCMMQVDKSNVSVTKRVTFGENPVLMPQPHMTAPTTDTSLKMNQLAAKYLNTQQLAMAPSTKPIAPTDMSYATKNYMERHKILKGNNILPASKPVQEIPKFLDITVLKQQPKLL